MALRAMYKGFKKVLAPLIINRPGELAIDQDALNAELNSVFFPRSEQAVLGAVNLNPYPYRSATGSSHGIDYTVNSNGSVTVDGTATGYSDFPLHDRNADPVKLPAGTYWVYGGYNDNVRVVIGRTYNGAWQKLTQSEGTPASFTVEEGDNLGVTVDVLDGTNVDNVTVYPMIATSPNYTDFVPFAMTNKELTDEVVSLKDQANNIKYTSDGTSYTNLRQYVVKPTITFASGVGTSTLYKPEGETITSFAVACANSDKAVAHVNISGTTATVTLTDTSFSSSAPVTIIYFTSAPTNREATREAAPEDVTPEEEPVVKKITRKKSTAKADTEKEGE